MKLFLLCQVVWLWNDRNISPVTSCPGQWHNQTEKDRQRANSSSNHDPLLTLRRKQASFVGRWSGYVALHLATDPERGRHPEGGEKGRHPWRTQRGAAQPGDWEWGWWEQGGRGLGSYWHILQISIALGTLSYLHFHTPALFSKHPVRTQDFVPFSNLEMGTWAT